MGEGDGVVTRREAKQGGEGCNEFWYGKGRDRRERGGPGSLFWCEIGREWWYLDGARGNDRGVMGGTRE